MQSRQPEPPQVASPSAMPGGMAARIRAHDWAATPLGPIGDWPASLRTTVRIMLSSRFAMWMCWGKELTFLCNDAYLPTLGLKRDWALGARSDKVWEEIWPDIGPRIEQVLSRGEATWDEGLRLFLERSGFPEETYHTFSYSPLADDAGAIVGMLCVVAEETERVLGERRLRILGELGNRAKEARSAEEACLRAAATLSAAGADVPFALIYLAEGEEARLAARTGLPEHSPAAPARLPVGEAPGAWRIGAAMARGTPVLAECRGRGLPGGPWDDPATQALVLPLAAPGQDRQAGALVCGVNSRRPLDAAYRSFFELLAGHVATAIANARAYEEERRRAEALAELDRAKTAFFSNVSHEFRTPLTLMLGPLEELLAAASVPPAERALAAAAHRNGLRLLRLVNTLLDFARVEAGRARARFVPTDLAALTADLASAFRSACDRAGLVLSVDCPALPAPVHVDREMWEKVVLNLLSNAFKFTFQGGIAVSLEARGGAVELVVRDTGTGIPEDELPRLFDRFHRVQGAAGRSHEGSGIGLALVKELVGLHGGAVTVDSEVGRGTAFRVTVPLGIAHLPADAVAAAPADGASATHADAFVQEALRWLPDGPEEEGAGLDGILPAKHGQETGRILVADDNADMRDYVRRLLQAAGHEVRLAPDGKAALEAASADPPDLVLSDVMMPRLDGFGLLRALRADPRTREAPIILLSARAGEEAEVEGLDAGADDYLVKPFAARELLARIGANLRLARIRQEAMAAEVRWRDLLGRMHEGFCICEMLRDAAGRPMDFRFIEASGGWERMTGMPRDFVMGRLASEVLPALEPHWLQAYAAVLESGNPAHFEQHAAPLGRWFEVSAYRIGPDLFGVLFLDVTARRVAAERQALLAREVDHRAKNALAVVQSVVRLTRARDVRDYARAVEGRVAALARAHTLLAEDKWRGAELRLVIEEELAAYRGGSRVVVEGPPVRLRAEAVQPLSMVVHELSTNAAKYGALSAPGGQVRVSWRRGESGLRLLWEERDGPPILVPPERRGFGSALIEATARGQLAGDVTLAWRTEGLRCELTVPAIQFAPADIAETEAGIATPAAPPAFSLRGLAVMVVEDEPLVAMELAETIAALGCRVVGPAATLEAGLRLAEEEVPRLAAAVLDVNLAGASAFPIADRLSAAGVPIVWATGYGELPPGRLQPGEAELLRKPLAEGELEAALRRAVWGGPSLSPPRAPPPG
jgi:signal transduction histidine kinase